MANNIFQTGIVPVKPKILNGERVFVYVPEASYTNKGIASFDKNHFNINNGKATLNTKYLSEAPFDRASLIKLDKADFLFVDGTTQINWPYAHNGSGTIRANKAGLVKVADSSAGYLKFTEDDEHYLEVDIAKVSDNVVKPALTEHNNSPTAHPSIRKLIDDNRNEMLDIANTKVDKIADKYQMGYPNGTIYDGRRYISNEEKLYLTIGDELVLPGTDDIVKFSGLGIRNDKVFIGNYNSITNDYSYLLFQIDSKTGLYAKPKLIRTRDGVSSTDSYLVTENELNEAVDTRVLKSKKDIQDNLEYEIKFVNHGSQLAIYSSVKNTETNDTNWSDITLDPTSFQFNGRQLATEIYVNNKVAEITSIQIRNKQPNLTIRATEDTVQDIATQYIIDNYDRQPQMNDGLFIVRTDKNNDTMEYAYFNNTWINTGLNGVDLSNYVDKTSTQIITGNKNFTGLLTKNGIEVATLNDIDSTDENAHKLLVLGANGTIGTNANFIVEDAESYIPYRNNLTEFIFSGIIPVTGAIDLTKEVTIDFGDTSYYLFDALDISRRLTLGDLDFALKESLVTGYNYLFRTVFFNNADVVGFAVLPAKEDVLSLNSDQMDDYMADGGLPNGQLAICNKVITNGYTEGGIYRFKITYPNTYEWEELPPYVKVDNISITKNENQEFEAVSLKNGYIDTIEDVKLNFNGIVKMTKANYEQLVVEGSVEIKGVTYNYDPSTIYDVEDKLLMDLKITENGTMLQGDKSFTTHVQILIEFETDGVHYGADFILHPYDNSICLVSYNFSTYHSMAYLDENGKVNIIIPDGLTFSNVKVHYMDLGE